MIGSFQPTFQFLGSEAHTWTHTRTYAEMHGVNYFKADVSNLKICHLYSETLSPLCPNDIFLYCSLLYITKDDYGNDGREAITL